VPRAVCFALVFAFAAAPTPRAQDHQHELPVVAADLLERPIALQEDIGRAHDQVSTSSSEAQTFYDQGITYLHHFAWIEAARSFNQALRFDSKLAMALAGLSVAQEELNQSTAARATFARARDLAASAGDHDRRHIEIAERRMAAASAPQDATRLAAYRKALDEALVRFATDAELWLERGVAESPDITDRGQGSVAGSIRFYDRALTIVPDYFAAHHYLTHAYENSGRVQEALTHGAAYATAAPGVAHARHMRGHDLRRVGRIEEAIVEFEAANRIELAALKLDGFRPEYDWHHEHNLDLLGTSYQYTGRVAKAEETLRAAFALPTANLVQAANKRQYLVFLRARGRADDALTAARTLVTFPHPVVEAIGHIESGYALLLKRQFAEAATETNAALAAIKRAPSGSGLAVVPFEGLQGEFFLLTGQRDKGRAMLDGMIKKARSGQGPDEWAQALFILESAARAAREAGDWEFAARMAQQMLDHDPSYAGTHYALALVAEHAGDRAAAAREYAVAAKLWIHADPNFPELREVRSKAEALGGH
jgi:tetratricopeptide (TPR) repeat protein